MIPTSVFELIHDAHIEDVIGKEIKLEAKGSNLIGICPFHEDKTPSFTVNPDKNMFKCFSCNLAGNAIRFIQEFKNLDFLESVHYVAKLLDIPIVEEELSPELVEHNLQINELKRLNAAAQEFFVDNLHKSPDALAYIKSRISDESIETFQIGYAPKGFNALFKTVREKGFLEENILLAGLISRNEKSGIVYNFFQDRITFPIISVSGAVTGFGGRVIPSDNPQAVKYFNTRETLLYSKKESVYGLKESLRGMRKFNYAILVEGPTDVIAMHEMGFNNTVACMGTSINEAQLKLIRKRVPKILFLLDGDDAGKTATIRAAKIAIRLGIFVEFAELPFDKDPSAMWTEPEDAAAWIKKNRMDFIMHYADLLVSQAANDPYLKNEAIKELTLLISFYPKDIQLIHVGNISDPKKLKPKLLTDRLTQLDREAAAPEEVGEEERLPPGVSIVDFIKYNFFEYKNEYHFGSKSHREKVSNFIMNPIFHIDSIFESKRIYEIVNCFGHKVVVNLDMQEMTSLQAFQRNVEGKGNFLFQGTALQFNKLKVKLYEKTRTCIEITSLGWQKEGFWAWSNGIHTPAGFEQIDEYGVCQFKGNNYFIPAFSSIYIHDKQVYLDERKFTFKDREVSIPEWAALFEKVYPKNSKMGIAFWITTVFRDHILHTFKNFPILNMFGPKGAGKSQFARSLTCLFGIGQTPFNVHNGTKAGLAEHLQQFTNAFAWIDEYKNALDFDKIETLKSIYDAIGRSRMNMDKGKKKETTAVNSGVLLSGQEMPTADVALFTRVIFLLFNKTSFSEEERLDYDNLKLMEEPGLSHFTNSVLCHREYFVKNFYAVFQEVMRDFNDEFQDNPVEDRILRSVVIVISSYRTIADVMPEFGFDYEEMKRIAFKSIRTQNDQINQSNELGQFWNALESMFDENLMIDKWHFRIDPHKILELQNKTNEYAEITYILKFKFNAIYNLYAQNARKQGLKPLPSDTLRYYLSNQSNYQGIQTSTSFTETRFDAELKEIATKRQVTSAMCFIYTGKPVNLSRSLDLLKSNIGNTSVDANTGSTKDPKDVSTVKKPEIILPGAVQTDLPF